MTPLDAREWLELQATGGDRFARELLAELAVADDNERLLEEWGEKVASDPDEAKGYIEQYEAFESVMEGLEKWQELNERFSGDDALKNLETLISYAKDCELVKYEMAYLAMDAELIERGDYETDPLPLIRMFLPVES